LSSVVTLFVRQVEGDVPEDSKPKGDFEEESKQE